MTWWRKSDLQRVRRACPRWECFEDQGAVIALLRLPDSPDHPLMCRQGTDNVKSFIEVLRHNERLYGLRRDRALAQ